ncbi:hypothetical protein QO002_000045 [Pararhizobium capsulatum DSM 1112]|uniref:Uncharacterized protein n=1 Tax=Pararhizobium capsulatum DSM 1112 TaxID=1121113 RepID=A0ABU0BI20_9HYPH|nr:hypothetical protein [Pararhizobium capsulatum DSM 1112]
MRNPAPPSQGFLLLFLYNSQSRLDQNITYKRNIFVRHTPSPTMRCQMPKSAERVFGNPITQIFAFYPTMKMPLGKKADLKYISKHAIEIPFIIIR